MPDIEQLAVNAIRALSMDAVQRANSGHPGMPMGMADIAVVLWSRFLEVDPQHPEWDNRDRFVLSNGHGSMLLYSLLHLSGFPLSMDDLKDFRQLGSPTPGHPEREPHLGIETTTGPLGQGFGNGVGMAIAEAHLRATLGETLVDHHTYGFVSDGDLMEGVASEAASLAGHLGLGRLIYYYDDNEISIEGSTGIAFGEDVERRFEAYGWQSLVVDGHDRQAIADATVQALAEPDRPSLITCKTNIGYGSPHKQDTAAAHGSPLGDEEIALTKAAMGWEYAPFEVPDEVYEFFTQSMARGKKARDDWQDQRARAFDADPQLKDLWSRYFKPAVVKADAPDFEVGSSVATRKASGKVINALAVVDPGLIGGSADLAPSTNTRIDGSPLFSAAEPAGRNFAFGVREHAMGSIVNGMALHGGLRPYGATFLTFSDYMRPSVRLAALMGLPSIWVWTHDSVFLGEDGPTHQPVEHLSALRAIPGLWVIRPADAGETAEAWEMALNRHDGPTAIVLTRQGVPVLDRSGVTGSSHDGGYVLREGEEAAIVATGSEVWVALAAAELLADHGHQVRVISMPCVEAFLQLDESERNAVLAPEMPVATLEAGVTWGWDRIAGAGGLTIGIDHFGASAPWDVLAEEYGLTAQAVADRVEAWLAAT